MEVLIEGFMAVLGDGSVWVAKGLDTPLPGYSRMMLYRLGPAMHRLRGLGESLRASLAIYPWLMRHDPCIDMVVPLVPRWEMARIIDPVEAASGIRGEAAELLELLGETRPGVTGSMALGLPGRDVDIVVYGLGEARRAYEILRELRARGVTRPLSGRHLVSEHAKNRVDTPLSLEEYRLAASSKVLLGVYKGVAYSARLVPRAQASICRHRVRKLGWCRLKARITGSPAPYLTPTRYEVEVLDAEGRWRRECMEAGVVETHRIRFMEYEEGSIVEVRGIVELRGSAYVVVPDHPGGVVRPL